MYAQGYQNWELVLADASTKAEAADYIREKSSADTRIVYSKIDNIGIAANTNQAIRVAKGSFVAFMDHDDTLDPNALAESVMLFQRHPEFGVVYSDEDKITDDGFEYFDPHFKPGFSLDTLRNVNYINHLTVMRADLLKKLGGIRENYDGAQDFDLLLRAVDAGAKFGHIPKILYHWREAENSTAADFSNKQYVTDSGRRALDDHFKRNKIKGVKAEVIPNRPGFYRTKYELSNRKRAIILDFSSLDITKIEKQAIKTIFENNVSVRKHDIVVLETSDRLFAHVQTVCRVNGLFIPANDQIDLSPLFGLAEEPGVDAVSPKIVRHGKIYDMGVVFDGAGRRMRLFENADPSKLAPFGSLEWVRNVDELSGSVIIEQKAAGKKQSGRFVVQSHVELVALDSSRFHDSYNSTGFYNANAAQNIEYVEEIDDYLNEFIEVN